MKTSHRIRRGLSAIELAAIATILGIIALIVTPHLTGSSSSDQEKLSAHHKAVINAAVERFYVETGAWPADDLSDIGRDANYFPEGIPTNPTEAGPYKLDSTTHRAK